MIIGGIQKFSLVDFPGKTSAVLFLSGCNMRCGYCHNPELVLPELFQPCLDIDEVEEFLKRRQGKLDGIVVSGGEPTIRKDLPELLEKIKNLGFSVKLDSNGTNPEMLEDVIKKDLVDYIAMDIKGPLERYAEITQRPIDTSLIQESINTIIDSGIEHEFRTTVVKPQLGAQDFSNIGSLIKGAGLYFLQKFSSGETLDPGFRNGETYSYEELSAFQKIMNSYVQACYLR